jgi:mannosyl-3-phosphoglycerate phosphatase
VRDILFTDLDGTLLDHYTYRPDPALPALRRLRQAGVLVLPATAKTLAEVVQIGAELGLTDGAIVENGAAIALPPGFPDPVPGGELEVVTVLGLPYEMVRGMLAEAAAEVGARVRGYGDMTEAEVAAETGLSPAEAVRARSRQWSETFVVTDGDPVAVGAALERRGLRAVLGARFLTAMGDHDKGEAARLVLDRLRRDGRAVRSWAVGDAANDAELLAAVDHPMLVRAGHGDWVDIDLPGLVRLDGVGPAGWALIPELMGR